MTFGYAGEYRACRGCGQLVGPHVFHHCRPIPSSLQEPTDADRIAALERRVAALEAARCPECHADLAAYAHKMSCSRGDGKGLRLTGRGKVGR